MKELAKRFPKFSDDNLCYLDGLSEDVLKGIEDNDWVIVWRDPPEGEPFFGTDDKEVFALHIEDILIERALDEEDRDPQAFERIQLACHKQAMIGVGTQEEWDGEEEDWPGRGDLGLYIEEAS